MDAKIANARAELERTRQQRQRARIEHGQFQQQTVRRLAIASHRIGALKGRTTLHVYYAIMNDTNQASYVTTKEALLCQALHQIEKSARQQHLMERSQEEEEEALRITKQELLDGGVCMEQTLRQDMQNTRETARKMTIEKEQTLSLQHDEINHLRGQLGCEPENHNDFRGHDANTDDRIWANHSDNGEDEEEDDIDENDLLNKMMSSLTSVWSTSSAPATKMLKEPREAPPSPVSVALSFMMHVAEPSRRQGEVH